MRQDLKKDVLQNWKEKNVPKSFNKKIVMLKDLLQKKQLQKL